MKRILVSQHISLDGYVAGPNSEMDWITVDNDIFAYVGRLTQSADTALYGRVTYGMMESYWPTADHQPNPTAHDIEHANWYRASAKVVASRTLKHGSDRLTHIISGDLRTQLQPIQARGGKNIIVFGSPSVVHALLAEDMVDELLLMVNPVLLGKGIPLFKGVQAERKLRLLNTIPFGCGVTAVHYCKA